MKSANKLSKVKPKQVGPIIKIQTELAELGEEVFSNKWEINNLEARHGNLIHSLREDVNTLKDKLNSLDYILFGLGFISTVAVVIATISMVF